MRPARYVGVSGITTRAQVDALLEAWPVDAPPQSLMLGVLASQKTLAGGERNARSPAPEEIAGLFPAAPRALNLVHYFTREPETLCEQLIRALGIGGERCGGIQINVPWPPKEELVGFSQWAPRGTRVVLQVGPNALDSVSMADPLERAWGVALRLLAYRGLITDVLVDASGGRGIPIDVASARPVVQIVRHVHPELGITIAGALCAEALPAVADLVREHDLSIDAEGKLRNERDELDFSRVHPYQRDAAPMICREDAWPEQP